MHEPFAAPPPPGFQRLWLARDWGSQHLLAGGDGPPLFLIHGLGGSHLDYAAMLPVLARHYTCLVPDHPGYGLSAKPDASYSIPYLAESLAGLAAELGIEKARWVGHSMGGHAVLWLGATRPDLVARLVGLCPAGGHDGRNRVRRALLATFTTRDDRLLWYSPGLMDFTLSFIFAQPPWGQAWEGMAAVRARFSAQWAGPERPLLERSLVRSAQGVLDHPLLGRLGGLRTPVLLVEGLGDRVIPASQTAAMWPQLPPGSQRVQLDGGHMLPYRTPGPLAEVLLAYLA
ncbi:MAG: alpha/beta hydrolase [Pseudomonadota bacterium]